MAMIRNKIEVYRSAVETMTPLVGRKWALARPVLSKLGVNEVTLKPTGIGRRVYCRLATSDLVEFTHHLGSRRTPLDLPFAPKTIVDAGANVGYSVLCFASEYPDAKIVALEPAKENIGQFKKNCGHLRNVTLEEAALWDTNTELGFMFKSMDSNAYRVMEEKFGGIRAITVDEVMRRHALKSIDLLKIDIEGSEKNVFSGPPDWIDAVQMILVETHDRIVSGCTDAVNNALAGRFSHRGLIGEYEFYVRRS